MEYVDEEDEDKTEIAIVGAKEDREGKKGEQGHGQTNCVASVTVEGNDAEIAEQESEHDILCAIKEGACKGDVPGKFGNKGEDKEVTPILASVVSVKVSFHYHEAEEGKGNASYGTEWDIPRYRQTEKVYLEGILIGSALY